ncbi:hypothetical protein H7100_03420 [Candidatus Saccharibacteria bacterium]|nr:hypothetical protein [Candidatus Saccharibacteria bacterium]
MTITSDKELTDETLDQIDYLAKRVSSPFPMSVQEVNVEAAKIAEEAGIVVRDVIVLVGEHAERRSPGGHPSERNEAFVSVTRFRDNKK